MMRIFGDMIAEKKVVVYLDDILVMGTTIKENNETLQKVLSRLSDENLILINANLAKTKSSFWDL